MSDDERSVRLEFEDSSVGGTGGSGEGGAGRSVSLVTLSVAIVGAGLLVASLLALGRSSSAAEPPPTSAPATTIAQRVRTPAVAPAPEPIELDPRLLTSLAPAGDGWIGTVSNQGRIVRSGDDGATWTVDTGPDAPTAAVSVGLSASGQPSALVQRDLNGDFLFETLVLRGNEWVLDPQRAPLAVPSDAQIRSLVVAEETIVVVEDQWDRPVAEVSAVLAEFVETNIADSTCRMVRNVVDQASVYSLFDCDGELVGQIGAESIEPRSEDDDRLSFAQDVLRSRYVVFVSSPDAEPERIEMGPAQLVVSSVPIDGGFAALVLDSLEVLDNPDLLFGGALAVRLVHWDRTTSAFTLAETPIIGSVWSANRLVANADGSITLVTSLGLYSARTPFVDWELVTTGPFDRLQPGQEFSSPLHGDGFFVNDPVGPGGFWASCCGADLGGENGWRDLVTEGQRFERALIATDSLLVIHTSEGEIVRVQQ